jgi:uncharacterized membrane protein
LHPGVLAPTAIYFFGGLLLIALGRAYWAIRRGDHLAHRRWMTRMFAVVLGVGAVRLVAVPLILLTGHRPLALAGVAFWIGFGGASIAGEVWLRAQVRRRLGAT